MSDAKHLSQDSTLLLIGSELISESGATLTSQLQSFETEMVTRDENFAGLEEISRGLIALAEAVDCLQQVLLDIDSNEISVYGGCLGGMLRRVTRFPSPRRAVDRSRFRYLARLEKEKCIRNGWEKRQSLASRYCRTRRQGSALKTRLEPCILTGLDVDYRSAGKSK